MFARISVAQNTITPIVIGSSGSENAVGNSGNSIQYTLGETFVVTRKNSSNILTQGFHQVQPSIVNVTPLSVNFNITEASCIGIYDGSINIESIAGCGNNYIIVFNGEEADKMSFDSLVAGSYEISIISNLACDLDTIITINTLDENCDVIDAYNAISPNGDNVNDTWTIVKIITEPNNTVRIYNRWGTLVWNAEGYNNKDIVWRGKSNKGGKLPDGTYFYVITLDNSGKILKGYVEITR